jgi:hypothetical protein
VIREVADGAGWLAAAGLAISIAWPYAIRGRPRAALQPHFWSGYLLAPAALAHGWATMKSGEARGASMLGTSLAAVALLPLAGQIFIGWRLRRTTGEDRRGTRRFHFAVMVLIASLVAVHLALVRW